jgi:TRAP-type transport system periplasmic protein
MPDNGGARPIYNIKREVKIPADLKGLKIRITASPVEPPLFKAWGASPVAQSLAETFTSIQTGVIDGHAMNWTWAYKLKYFDLLKYATEVDYIINTSLLSMRTEAFDKLPKDLQKVLLAAGKETEKFSVSVDAAEVDEARKSALAKGIKIYTPKEEEMKQWKSIAFSVYDQFKDKADLELVKQIQKAK